jgi:type I restriction-modification system DNA methylase subunit
MMAAGPKVAYAGHASTSSHQAADGTALSVTGDRKGKCFLVPADEIRANKYDLSNSRYKQIEHKEIEYEKPGVIMGKVMALEREIAKDVQEIKKML